ncbi:MAG TPA: hypothetical protein VFI47_26410 [Acidimicrobiales bacterium]|nr:hypothetical protein [Acidimicrobiales bacterium]
MPGPVLAALVVVLAVAGDVTYQRLQRGPAAVTADHRWPASLDGPVWVRVAPPDGGGRTVALRWGPWRREVRLRGDEPVTYALTKRSSAPAGNAALTVAVDPGAAITFGTGPPPAVGGAIVDLDGGWRGDGDGWPPLGGRAPAG